MDINKNTLIGGSILKQVLAFADERSIELLRMVSIRYISHNGKVWVVLRKQHSHIKIYIRKDDSMRPGKYKVIKFNKRFSFICIVLYNELCSTIIQLMNDY